MKLIRQIFLAVCLAVSTPLIQISCTTTPSQQNVQVQTLKATGQIAEQAVALSAQLYRDRKITAEQARQVADLYDSKFQPAFRFAVAAVNSDLSKIASPDVISLAQQLASLVASFQSPPK